MMTGCVYEALFSDSRIFAVYVEPLILHAVNKGST